MQTVTQLDYHRNGVSGLGFHVGIVEEPGDDGTKREMLVVRFPKEADQETGNVVCAAFDLAKLDKREIRFFYNSWRGDHYSDVMDDAIEAQRKERNLHWEMEQAYKDLQTVPVSR